MEKHQGYIVERIIDQQRQNLCFEGTIRIEGLSQCLCPPLRFCSAEVLQVQPCDRQEGHMGACRCVGERTERVAILLCCRVMDSRGQREEGLAWIETEACLGRCFGNVRRGAEIEVSQARFCGSSMFEICAQICLLTIVSRSEMACAPCMCKPACPQLPLYPPAPNHPGRNRRLGSRTFDGCFSKNMK